MRMSCVYWREVNENEKQILNENELRVFGKNGVNVENLNVDAMNVGSGLMNNNARMCVNNDMYVLDENRVVHRSSVQVIQADVHAAPPSATGLRVSRGLSSFDPLIEALPAHCVATMTAATACTTTTSMSLPNVRRRTDLST